ncbi:hypothetical protein BJ742DRAFT_472764 [Cladochytrium replicatum]|nr:hypothetical protein BJ742DRAFT_472764 [Cladochytrium replicatum]
MINSLSSSTLVCTTLTGMFARRHPFAFLLLAAASLSSQCISAQSSILEVLRANKNPLVSTAGSFNLAELVDTILPKFPAVTSILQDPTPKVFIAPSNTAISSSSVPAGMSLRNRFSATTSSLQHKTSTLPSKPNPPSSNDAYRNFHSVPGSAASSLLLLSRV